MAFALRPNSKHALEMVKALEFQRPVLGEEKIREKSKSLERDHRTNLNGTCLEPTEDVPEQAMEVDPVAPTTMEVDAINQCKSHRPSFHA